jgi:hypothetical protein
MVDQQTQSPETPAPDRTARTAALWATAVAVPVAVLAGVFLFSAVNARSGDGAPTPTATTPAVVSTAPVTMAAPKLSERATTVCRAVLSQLPTTVRDLPQRPVTAGPEQNAAYGDPAVTVTCGVPQPKVAPESVVLTMNRVCWYNEQHGDATVWTTIGREVPVAVTVPSSYAQPAQWANEFSDTVVATVKSAGAIPAGCG